MPKLLEGRIEFGPGLRELLAEPSLAYHFSEGLYRLLGCVHSLHVLVPGHVCWHTGEGCPILPYVALFQHLRPRLLPNVGDWFCGLLGAPSGRRQLSWVAIHRFLPSLGPRPHETVDQQSPCLGPLELGANPGIAQHLQHPQCLGINDPPHMRRIAPIVQITQKLNKGGLVKIVLRGQPMDVVGVRQRLQKLQLLDETPAFLLYQVLQLGHRPRHSTTACRAAAASGAAAATGAAGAAVAGAAAAAGAAAW
mmetsp:Transcript_26707/g.88725  ORF Transcript_26707/g.88725 Transcript_26707/m.88725 type:complete len:251 (-) Transcript_26707:624-1376(-)